MTAIHDGFRLISGKRSPPRDGKRYFIQLRMGFVDERISYTAEQLCWVHDGGPGDVVAVKVADD
jgi:hypothetical protein